MHLHWEVQCAEAARASFLLFLLKDYSLWLLAPVFSLFWSYMHHRITAVIASALEFSATVGAGYDLILKEALCYKLAVAFHALHARVCSFGPRGR